MSLAMPRPPRSRPPRSARPVRPAPRPPRARNVAPAKAAATSAAEVARPQRIAKLLARAGVASRRDVERMIAEGRIALTGEVLTTPATLLTDLRGVTVDGKAVAEPGAARLFLFHKPAGCLTTARDSKGRRTIYDLLPPGLPRLQPIGRLDMNTEGLLLLTTDGELKRALELPVNAVERKYRVRVYGRADQAALDALSEGVSIEGVRYGPILADLERRTGANGWLTMTLTEGKNREVRNVAKYLGLEVTRLIRTAYGPFSLGNSEPGQIIEASVADIDALRRQLPKGEKASAKARDGGS